MAPMADHGHVAEGQSIDRAAQILYRLSGQIPTLGLSDIARQTGLRRPLQHVTPATVVDAEALRREVDKARHTGYGLSFAERTPGIHTMAAPIFDRDGSVVGCLSVSGRERRMPAERMDTLASRFRDAAWTVSEKLGATGKQIPKTMAHAERKTAGRSAKDALPS